MARWEHTRARVRATCLSVIGRKHIPWRSSTGPLEGVGPQNGRATFGWREFTSAYFGGSQEEQTERYLSKAHGPYASGGWRRCDSSVRPGEGPEGLGAFPFAALLHLSLQYLTSSQTFSHFFLHVIGFWHSTQIFTGRVDLVYFFFLSFSEDPTITVRLPLLPERTLSAAREETLSPAQLARSLWIAGCAHGDLVRACSTPIFEPKESGKLVNRGIFLRATQYAMPDL